MIPDLSTVEARRELFAQALESGRYAQTIGVLRRDHRGPIEEGSDEWVDAGFCCWGVACDLSIEAGIGYWDDPSHSSNKTIRVYIDPEPLHDVNYHRHDCMPPASVYEWFGFVRDDVDYFVDRNDNHIGFTIIADEVRHGALANRET